MLNEVRRSEQLILNSHTTLQRVGMLSHALVNRLQLVGFMAQAKQIGRAVIIVRARIATLQELHQAGVVNY